MTINPKKLWNKDFILLWQGTAVSVFGDVLYSIAIGYWVYRETGSTALMGTMSSISMFVAMFLNPFTGAIVDRINRKSVIVGMDALRGILMIVVGFMALKGHLSVEMVLFTAFIAAICNVMFQPATTTVFVDLVPASELVRAQSLTHGTISLIDFFGKGISGALLTFFGVGPMILLNGLSFLISAFTETFIKVPKTLKQELNQTITVKRILGDVAQGAKDAMATPGLNVLLISALIANFVGSGYSALMLPLATMKGMSLTEYGMFIGLSSLAAVLALAILGIFKIKPKHKMPIFIGAFVLNTIFVIVGLLGKGFVWLTVFFFLGDFMMVIGNALLNATMILAIPRDKRATVFGFVSSFSIAGVALSMLGYGFLAEIYDLSVLAIIGTSLSFFAILPIFGNKGIWKLMSQEDPKPIQAPTQ
ncbi:MAG: Transporter major facilitator family [Erysipelotrichaceae bacterium]|nr:MAG: Transporter major facilitator family [Erysipelotrichaceae bacterium]